MGNVISSFSSATPSVPNSGLYTGTKALGRFRFCALSEVYQWSAGYRTYGHVYPTTNYGDGTYDWTLVADGTYTMAICI